MRHVMSVIFCLLLSACGGGGSSSPAAAQTTPPEAVVSWSYSAPVDLSDGWSVSSLGAESFQVSRVTELMTAIIDDDLGIDGVAIARNGRLVLDELVRTELTRADTDAGNGDIDLHAVYSVTKSVNAALVGIAVDQGLIGINDGILGAFPQYAPVESLSAAKQKMTVGNFLTMRHGLDWDELSVPYGEPGNSLTMALESCTDYVACLLDLPMVSEPGSTFSYATHASLALGVLVEQRSGMDYQAYINQKLLTPLQISRFLWSEPTPTGRTRAGSGLFLTTRDMTKLGQLYLDGGVWNSSQIVSASWINASLKQHVELPGGQYVSGYGYQWWLYELAGLEAFAAVGFGGQYVIVVPEKNLVVSFTSRNYNSPNAISLPLDLLADYIIPALAD